MSIIKAARVYRVDLPSAATLATHLNEIPFRDIQPQEKSTRGFINPTGHYDMVLPIESGYAFTFRLDEKILPYSVMQAEIKKRIQAREAESGESLTKEEREVVQDQIAAELVRHALVRTHVITSIYLPADRLLIVPTTNRRIANEVTSLLVRCVGSIKAQTIYVDNAKHGLTIRLKKYLEGDDESFDGFYVGGSVKLKLPLQKSMQVKVQRIEHVEKGLLEAIEAHAQVTEIELLADGLTIRLRDDFVISRVKFDMKMKPDPTIPAVENWTHEASVQSFMFAKVVNDLCDLVGYKEPKPEESV